MRTASFQTALFFGVIALMTVSLVVAQPAQVADQAQHAATATYTQRMASARIAYFRDVEGDHQAHDQAREQFAALARERPGDAAVQAYIGSLDLLDAARTWAVWNKHELSQQGLRELDSAVNQEPDNLEARFIRAATTWHLPSFFHRREQAESDLAYIAPRAAEAVAKGTLPPQLAAAALDYYGQALTERSEHIAARSAYEAAVRIDESSPGGKDASRRLKEAD